MIKIVFFGSIGIAKKILQELILTQNIELMGVCCESRINSWRNEESVYDFAKKMKIPILAYDDIIGNKYDLGISVRYNRIIPQSIIDSFRLGIVNTHGGILPEYRGSYCNVNALINGEAYYGVTLHYIDSGVDTGDIVDTLTIPIEEDDTGFDLYKKSEQLCYEIINKNILSLLNATNKRFSQNDLVREGRACNQYKAKETLALKNVTDVTDNDELLRKVRAFDSAEHEPAYKIVNNKKIYLRYKY